MRSVCGCTPASSAATEITYTARVRSPPRLAITDHLLSAALLVRRSRPSYPQALPGRGDALGRRHVRLDRLALGVVQLLGDRQLDGDQQVAAALLRLHATALHP